MTRQLECPTCGDPVLRTHRCKGAPPPEPRSTFDRVQFERWRAEARAEALLADEQLELEL